MDHDDVPEAGDFRRRPAVDHEIAHLIAADPATWVALAKLPESRGGMTSEAMVHLVRRLRRRPESARVLGALVVALDARVARLVARWARGFDEVTTEEIALAIGGVIVELCLGEGSARAADFLEASFSTAVKRRTLDAVDLRRRAPKPHAVAAALRRLEHGERPADCDGGADGDVDPEDDRGDVGGDPRADAALDPERALIARQQAMLGPEAIRAALAKVRDPRHREAVVLHHFEGWPIVDQDPAIETLCKRFGVGDRQIRTWIATAFAQMRRAIGAAP